MNQASSQNNAELMKSAVAHHRAGRLGEAEKLYRQVLESEPKYPSALYFLGLMAHQVGRHEQAVKYLEQAIEINPKDATYRVILGNANFGLGRFDIAEASHREAIRLSPNIPEAHLGLATALHAQRRLDEAQAAARQAIALKPSYTEAHLQLAAAQRDSGQIDSAIEALRASLGQGVNRHIVLNNLGNSLALAGKLDEAREALEQSVEAGPNMPQAHWNLSIICLMQGDYERGFAEQEWRLKHPASGARKFAQPMWDGKPLAGRSILLHAEQGFGDAVQFSRYASRIGKGGGRVILEVPPELKRLLSTVDGVDEIVAMGDPLPPFDLQAPLMSLPFLFKTTVQSIPSEIPYLKTDPALVQQWRAQMNTQSGERKVGLVWAGRPTHRNDVNRSISLLKFAPLAGVPGIRWYSLQLGPAAGQPRPEGLDLIDLTGDINDFADTAALLANLDLLISVDTAAVHVAAALGLPVWVLLPEALPDWRWGLQGASTPWYPSARLFRQPARGDWESVLRNVAAELAG